MERSELHVGVSDAGRRVSIAVEKCVDEETQKKHGLGRLHICVIGVKGNVETAQVTQTNRILGTDASRGWYDQPGNYLCGFNT